ncbi:MAG: hypothetical protein AB1512_30705 [Thermodesulfobacteriota bacterium]
MEKRSGSKKGCMGVTQTEVLVACLIITIMGTFSAPALSSWLRSAQLKAAARDLYGNLQRTKMLAIKNNTDCSITYGQLPDRYVVSGITRTVNLSEYGNGVRFEGPQGQTFSVPTITFNNRGTCNAGYAYLTNEDRTAYYRVGPSWSSGMIRFQQYSSGEWR